MIYVIGRKGSTSQELLYIFRLSSFLSLLTSDKLLEGWEEKETAAGIPYYRK